MDPLVALSAGVATALGAHSPGWGIPFTVREVVVPTKPAKDCENLELLVWMDPEGEEREQYSKNLLNETAFINVSIVQRVESDAAFRGLIAFSSKAIAERLAPIAAGDSVWAHKPAENKWLQRYNPYTIQQDENGLTGEFIAVIALAFRRVI